MVFIGRYTKFGRAVAIFRKHAFRSEKNAFSKEPAKVSRDELLVCEQGAQTARYLRISNPMREERRHLTLDFSGVQQRPMYRNLDDGFEDDDEEWPPHPEEAPEQNNIILLSTYIFFRVVVGG